MLLSRMPILRQGLISIPCEQKEVAAVPEAACTHWNGNHCYWWHHPNTQWDSREIDRLVMLATAVPGAESWRGADRILLPGSWRSVD